MAGDQLRGRRRERETLDRLLRDVRSGQSRVLVLRGEAGVGKTALLDYLVEQARAGRVVAAAGVEPETELAYSALQQVCAPLLGHLDRLPEPQRDALATAFGLSAGRPPEALIVGLAVLGLLAEAATERPLLCVVDDAQWLDRMSEVVLVFVARRLDAESVALVFAARDPGTPPDPLGGLPELRVGGLPDADARALLDSVLPGPIDARVRDRILAETRGNPLALLELPRDLTPAELAFGFGVPTTTPLQDRVEDGFRRRIAALPGDTRRLLLAAAVEPIGDVPLLWRAAAVLGIAPAAAVPAETAGLVEFGARVGFRHPLVRSAAWRAADPAELRAVHAALAEVTDAEQDPDRRAWHRAHAAVGPNEEVAAELERSADRALARGGRAAAAAFLERAAELTLDSATRAARTLAAAQARFASGAFGAVPGLLSAAEMGPLDPVQRAVAERLRARVAFAVNAGRAAVSPLLEAAARLAELDPAAARETFVSAIGAALNAGRFGIDDLGRAVDAAAAATAGDNARPAGPGAGDDPAGRVLAALIAWHRGGHVAAVPLFRRALDAITPDRDLDLLWLGGLFVHEVWDDEQFLDRNERAVAFARESGNRSLLPTALTFRATALIFAGRFADASDLIDEAEALARVTGPSPHPAAAALLAAHRGRADTAAHHDRADTAAHHDRGDTATGLIDALAADAEAGGMGWLLAVARHSQAVLHNGLGNYPAALAASSAATDHENLAVLQWGLTELVEAAARAGEPAVAAKARDRLAEHTAAVDTAWARGTQALADALAGPAADADGNYRRAVAEFATTRLDLQLARARLLYGEWLRRHDRRADARAQLRPAHDAFSTMGAEGFADRAGRELLATGETIRKRSAPGVPEELTPQEAQIARLAAAGRTNPEIGAVLFLSPRTVEWHLRKIFAKLGVTSRRELRSSARPDGERAPRDGRPPRST
ncbi:helix-turn-helix transcriptional regulator [Paractinoplanes toevensis]|uniref:LuxR family transcriptional regulator n=1 Tax=Paractinoplanes toevensis TaxID=571911 RepID=A0A919T7Z9_9ACTN|nr:LuxR family transcriptional regulator [Actinoplanes toevensis]GIM90690.1 LuxR family transcriptional regulator [Actinoplanes toevensis]